LHEKWPAFAFRPRRNSYLRDQNLLRSMAKRFVWVEEISPQHPDKRDILLTL